LSFLEYGKTATLGKPEAGRHSSAAYIFPTRLDNHASDDFSPCILSTIYFYTILIRRGGKKYLQTMAGIIGNSQSIA